MRKWFRAAALGAVAISTGGCALPPAIEVASLVLGGASFLATGKGLSDHALSFAVGEDCALIRSVMGKPICIPEEEAEDWAVALGEGRFKGLEDLEQIALSIDVGTGAPRFDWQERDPRPYRMTPTEPDLDAVAVQLAEIDTAAGGRSEVGSGEPPQLAYNPAPYSLMAQ